MRGCAGLKLSGACVRGAGGAMARGWSTPQSRPRVAVPIGLFRGNRRTRGSRLESVFCCFAVRSPAYSFFPNVTVQRTAHLVRRTLEPLVGRNYSLFSPSPKLSPIFFSLRTKNKPAKTGMKYNSAYPIDSSKYVM